MTGRGGFRWLSSAIQKMSGHCLKLDHGRFFPPQILGKSECVSQTVSLYFRNLSRDRNQSLWLAATKSHYLLENRRTLLVYYTRKVLQDMYLSLTVHLGIILVNNQLDTQLFSAYVYFDALHVSSNHVFIIRRISCINTTGICHST